MGTNFYLLIAACEHCHRPPERLHIGKDSAGWSFMFRSHPDRGIQSFEDWKKILARPNQIEDEYGFLMSYAKFVGLVEAKRDSPDNHARDIAARAQRGDFLDSEGNLFIPEEFD